MTSTRSFVASLGLSLALGACLLPPKSAGEDEPIATGTGTGTSTEPPPVAVDSSSGSVSSTSSSPSSSGPGPVASSTTEGATYDCRDAAECVIGCLMRPAEFPEPDLSCFLNCEDNLTVDEALDLFELVECVTNECTDQGVCEILERPRETEGEGSDSGTSSGTTGGSSGSTGGVPSEVCIECITAILSDPEPRGMCQDVAVACQ